MASPEKTVAIIGGGPVGLAAAAHALDRGLRPIVLEAGDRVGHAVSQCARVLVPKLVRDVTDRVSDRARPARARGSGVLART